MPQGTLVLDARDLRMSGASMLTAALVLPLIPGHPGVACPLRRFTGIPCPLCGMTTSVEATVHFQLGPAFAANPGGILLAAAALALLIVRPSRIHIPSMAPMLVLSTLWFFELHRFAIL